MPNNYPPGIEFLIDLMSDEVCILYAILRVGSDEDVEYRAVVQCISSDRLTIVKAVEAIQHIHWPQGTVLHKTVATKLVLGVPLEEGSAMSDPNTRLVELDVSTLSTWFQDRRAIDEAPLAIGSDLNSSSEDEQIMMSNGHPIVVLAANVDVDCSVLTKDKTLEYYDIEMVDDIIGVYYDSSFNEHLTSADMVIRTYTNTLYHSIGGL